MYNLTSNIKIWTKIIIDQFIVKIVKKYSIDFCDVTSIKT